MYDGDQGTGYPAIGVNDQPIGARIRRRTRLDQQSDHAAFILPPRPVKWVNAKALRLDILGNRPVSLVPIPRDGHDDD